MVRVRKKYGCGAAGLWAGSRTLLFGAALLATAAAVPFSVRAEDAPLAGLAYTNATEAYAAFKKGDYPTAIAKTKEAIKLRPDSLHLRLLLIDALFAADKFDEADAAATEAISKLGSNADLVTRQNNIRERIGYKAKAETYAFADNALKAFARQDYPTAISEATKAVAADPTNRSYRLILVNSLIAANDFDEAKKQIEEAIAKVGSDSELLTRQQFVAERIAARPRMEAFAAAEAAYKAFAQKDYATAAEYARKAIQLDPDNSSYQTLLKNIERTARAPVQVQSRGEMLAQRGYAKQRRGDYAGAAVERSPIGAGYARLLRLELKLRRRHPARLRAAGAEAVG
jgi:tetratricopeptide (TPR) repeat protein